MQSSNPAISVLRQNAGAYNFGGIEQGATISGTTTKSLLLVALTLVVGYVAMSYTLGQIFYAQHMPTFLIYGSLIAAVVVAFITIFKPTAAPITAPIYAILEGCALGSVSAMFEIKMPGIVTTAVLSTFVVVMTMLALWKFKIIVPTQRFKSIITGAMGGIFVLYLINIVVSLFGGSFLPQTGPLSIIISLVVCTVAAFSLVLDFENIQVACDEGLPKHFEYYNAFSLLVTICWLYIEILKLLSKRE
jgi:uncharacterized YccA/Bax inhibitor family protein